ncbi:hypothetical protein Avbf_16187, partial [Armadillidium vulgare]
MQQTVYARIAYERNLRKKGIVPLVSRRKKTFLSLLRNFIRALVVFFFTQVGVCFLLILYNVVGAFSFRAIEGYNGDSTIEEKAESMQNITINLIWNITLQLNILEERLWRERVSLAVLNYQKTLVPLIRKKNYRGVKPIEAWTIPGSLMYSLSIYTTI